MGAISLSNTPPRNATIRASTALNAFRKNAFFFDPDQPHKSAEQLYRENGSRLNDPRTMNHGCPYCDRVLTWEIFEAHFGDCRAANWLTKIDITRRKFAGATIQEGSNA